MINYYKILEVNNFASYEEIRASYLRLARKYHPDANIGNPESTEIFQYISEAHEVLTDQQKRTDYDLKLKAALFFPVIPDKESLRAKRREEIIRKREKVIEFEISQYEKNLKLGMHKRKLVIAILLVVSGLLMMLSEWFPNLLEWSRLKAILGLLIFSVGVSLCSNLYYVKHRVVSLKTRIENHYVRRSIRFFLLFYAIGLVSLPLYGSIRKYWHLKNYATVIHANIVQVKAFDIYTLHFKWEDKEYMIEITANENDMVRDIDKFALIRISGVDPRIAEFIEKEQ